MLLEYRQRDPEEAVMGPQHCLDHGEHGHRPAPFVQLCRSSPGGGWVRRGSESPGGLRCAGVILGWELVRPDERDAYSGLSW